MHGNFFLVTDFIISMGRPLTQPSQEYMRATSAKNWR